MDKQLAHRIGRRVRFHLAAGHRTKVVVAGLAGISEDYLYQIERGLKMPTVPVLMALAEALDCSVNDLVDERPGDQADSAPASTAGDELHRALNVPEVPETPVALAELDRLVRGAWATWQTSPTRYSQVRRELPGLIRQVEHAVNRHTGAEQREAHRQAADLYGLVRTVTKRVGRIDLSLLAADRAIRAGRDADDPLRRAAASWNKAQVLLAQKDNEGAEAVALTSAHELRPEVARGHLDALALNGALLLVAAVAEARQRQAWTALDRLRAAESLAKRTGERNTHWTAFGPLNVDMIAVSVAVDTGQASEALRLAERINYVHSPSIERRVAFLLDQAKGYQQRRDYGSALAVLLATAEEALEDLQHRPAAHALLEVLVRRGRRTIATGAARLAARVGVPL